MHYRSRIKTKPASNEPDTAGFKEKAKYNIDRFKGIVTNANKLGLLFFFTLTYVWFKSIEPAVLLLEEFVDLTPAEIKSVKQERQEHHARFSSFRNKEDSLKAKHAAHLYDSLFKKKEFLKDCLRNIKLQIEIPTLSKVELDLRFGIFVWFSLFFALFYLFDRYRVQSHHYLLRGMYYHRRKIKANNYNFNCLDVHVPFWVGPVQIEGNSYERKVLYVVTKWKGAYNFILVLILGLLLSMLVRVWWINLNVNNAKIFVQNAADANNLKTLDSSLLMIFLGTLISLAPLVFIIKWLLFPIKIRSL